MSGWPWPLSAVQGWFDGLWSWISEAANAAVSVVYDWITDGLEWLSGFVQDTINWLHSALTSGLSTVRNIINAVGSNLSAAFSSAINAISSTLSNVGSWLYNHISALASGISSAVTSAADGLASFVTNGLASIGQGLANLGSSLVGTITGAVDGAIKWAQDGLSWLSNTVMAVGSDIISGITGAFEAVGAAITGGIGTLFGPILEGAQGLFNVLGNLGTGFDPGGLIADAMAALESIFDVFTKALSSKSPRTPEEAYTITWDTINQVSAAYMTQAVSLIIAEAVSIGQLDIAPQGLAHTPQMDSALNTVQTLYSTMADISLVRPLQYFMNRAFTPELPPTVDLIRFVVREVMTPERFYELMPWQGFSSEWAVAYWEAHWVLPDPSRLIDAFHRKVINRAEFDKYIVWHDYKPEPRPGISVSDLEIYARTLKTLIPRVDIRYAWEMGLVDDAGLEEWYEFLGYEEDAPLMAAIQKVRAMVEEINKVRNEDLSAFVDGLTDESTLRANLEALGISTQRIDYYVAYAKKRRERNQTKELLDIYQDGYVNDQVDDQGLEKVAADLIVDERARSLFLDRAYVRKYMKPRLTPSD